MICINKYFYIVISINKSFNKLKYIFSNKKRLSLMFLGLFFIFCAINVPNLFFRISLDENSNLKCDSTPLINQIRNMIISLFRVILPIIFQIVFSALLIYKLFKVSRSVNRNQLTEKEYCVARRHLFNYRNALNKNCL
jgi:flagellar biosynthesis protein FlhB